MSLYASTPNLSNPEWEELRARRVAAMASGGLERLTGPLTELARPAVRLRSETGPCISRSQLGGEPDLPAGMMWPEHRGAPLAFIAQIDLAEMPEVIAELGLPTAGTLSFFYDIDDGWGAFPHDYGFAQTFYFAPDAELTTREFPDALDDRGRYPQVTLLGDLDCTFPLAADMFQDGPDADALEQVIADATQQGAGQHQLLGCAYPIQGDSLTEMPTTRSQPGALPVGVPDLRTDSHSDWLLLLQIDSDNATGMMWGDVGVLYVCITAADLAARRFDRSWTTMQCC